MPTRAGARGRSPVAPDDAVILNESSDENVDCRGAHRTRAHRRQHVATHCTGTPYGADIGAVFVRRTWHLRCPAGSRAAEPARDRTRSCASAPRDDVEPLPPDALMSSTWNRRDV